MSTKSEETNEVKKEVSSFIQNIMDELASGNIPEVESTSPTHMSTFTKRDINKLSWKADIAEIIAFPQICAFPFNPFTGVKEEVHKKGGFTTVYMLPSKLLYAIKCECFKNPDLKKVYEAKAGLAKGSWKIDEVFPEALEDRNFYVDYPKYLTETDLGILGIYTKELSNYSAVTVVSQKILATTFNKPVLIDTARDSITGEFADEKGPFHNIAYLVSQMVSSELKSFKDNIQEQTGNILSKALNRNIIESLLEVKAEGGQDYLDSVAAIKKFYPCGKITTKTNMVGFSFATEKLTGRNKSFLDDDTISLLPEFDDVNLNRPVFTNNFSLIGEVQKVKGANFHTNPTRRQAVKDVLLDFYIGAALESTPEKDITPALEKDRRLHFTLQSADTMYTITETGKGNVVDFKSDADREFYITLCEKTDGFFKEVENITKLFNAIYKSYEQPTDALVQNIKSNLSANYTLDVIKNIFPDYISKQNLDTLSQLYPDEYLADELDSIDDLDIDGDNSDDKIAEAKQLRDEAIKRALQEDDEEDEEDVVMS